MTPPAATPPFLCSRWRAPFAGALVAALLASGALVAAVPPTVAAAAVGSADIVLPGVVWPLDVATAPGDAIWIARGPTVERVVPGSGTQTISLPNGSNARHLAVAPDGTLWFGGLSGSLGTIAPNGTVTTRALADASATVNSLTVGRDGALWVLASGTTSHVERGAPGGPMTVVATPSNSGYDAVVAGGIGAVLVVGNEDASIAADGTVTPVAGVPGGTTTDTAAIGDETWVTTTSGMAVIDDAGTVTAYALAAVPGGTPASITAGPNARAWYAAGGGGGVADLADSLGRVGADGPDASTLLVTGSASPKAIETWHLVADPAAERLWAVSYDGAVTLRPIDVSRQLSSISVDDPGPDLAFGVPVTLTARTLAFPGATLPTSGTVTFSTGGTVLGTTGVQPGGIATITVAPPADSLMVTATSSGNATHAPAVSRTTSFRPVADAPSTTTLTPPSGPLRPGQATFKVRVTSTSPAMPSGTVHVGSLAIPVSGGVDTSFTVDLAPGTNSFTATFMPDPGFTGSSAPTGALVARWDRDEENYVMAAYLRLFGRYPDPAGRTYWANKLEGGLSRDRFALAQVATSEYRRKLAKRVGLVAPGATVAQSQPTVDAMANQTVRELLVDHWAAGKKVVNCKDTIAPQFAPDGSFMCWVKVIFTTFTGSANSDDYAWASRYGNTPEGRRAVAKILVYSDTAVRPVVEAAYSTYLGRSPDSGGWTYWTKKIQGGMREEGVDARVLGSDEFYRRTLLPTAP